MQRTTISRSGTTSICGIGQSTPRLSFRTCWRSSAMWTGSPVCDLACGQGWVARELARRGAQVTGLDLAPNLLALARRYEEQEPLGIVYVQGDAERADPLSDRQFTGCVCVMALINIPDLQATFQSVRRI